MKKSILFILTILFTMNTLDAQKKGEEVLDKSLALDLLQRTMEELEKIVEPLDSKELGYVPQNGGWSVLNCLEHLALVEPVLFLEIKKMIETNTLNPGKDLSTEDGLIITYITDRTKKVMTPKPFRPLEANKHKTKEDFLEEIRNTRAELISLLKSTDANLRHLFGPYPYGEADAYQQFIIAAAHSHRHILQIKEILSELENKRSK
ncbi:DinB family protein [Ulvibacterium marinum]|uniref:DinB family protein n=1 Tax=Ulvibacterium marinum TaxID=2419782 RepID=A0A3B0C4N5_9FLAO|nr:DinB family protein [Ulvibacterium marinum]RKN79488.1 DinB family protein [Ulvibacterium marinum]